MAIEKGKEKIKSGGFKDEERPRQKGSTKTPPKKANHKHEYEPVLLAYFDEHFTISKERGWSSGVSHHPGSRCKICQRLVLGFPKGSEEAKHDEYDYFLHRRDLLTDFPSLPRIPVKDLWNL